MRKLFIYKRNTNSYLEEDGYKTSRFDIFFSLIFLLGLYSGISFYITDTLFIPYILSGISSIYFLFKNFSKLKTFHLMPIVYLAVVTFIGVLISDSTVEFFLEKMKGFVQLFYSIIISYLFYLNLRKWSPQCVCNLFLVFIIFILIGTFFEISTEFKDVSDKFREEIFKTSLYEADLRDIYFYGIIRPKLFTEEPSHVAKFYILSLFVWFSLTNIKLRYILLCVFLLLGIYLIRSPLIFLAIPISVLIEIFFRKKLKFNLKSKTKELVIEKSFAILLILITIVLTLSFNTILDKRVNQIINRNDESFSIRFTGPFLIAIEVLKKYPLWGAGISGKEVISEIINDVYYNIDVKYYNIYSFSTNLIMIFFIYFGILGAVMFGTGIFIFVKRLKIQMKFFLFANFIIFSQTMGGFASLRPWGYFFIIATVSSFSKYYAASKRMNLPSNHKLRLALFNPLK